MARQEEMEENLERMNVLQDEIEEKIEGFSLGIENVHVEVKKSKNCKPYQ